MVGEVMATKEYICLLGTLKCITDVMVEECSFWTFGTRWLVGQTMVTQAGVGWLGR